MEQVEGKKSQKRQKFYNFYIKDNRDGCKGDWENKQIKQSFSIEQKEP